MLLYNTSNSKQQHSTSDHVVIGFKLPTQTLKLLLIQQKEQNQKQHLQHNLKQNIQQEPQEKQSQQHIFPQQPRKFSHVSLRQSKQEFLPIVTKSLNKSSNSHLSTLSKSENSSLSSSLSSSSYSSSSPSKSSSPSSLLSKPLFQKSTLFYLNSSTSSDFLQISLVSWLWIF